MNAEQWQPVVGFEGLYEVSSLGRVASLPTSTWPTRRVLATPAHARGGYPYVTLHHEGRYFHRKVHHLVCLAFVGPRPDGMLCRHLDGDVTNNVPANLVWGTARENLLDAVRHGRHHNASKTKCRNGHKLSGKNLYVNATSGSRQCRICQNVAKARYAQKKRMATK
jgi:hypothetical protein